MFANKLEALIDAMTAKLDALADDGDDSADRIAAYRAAIAQLTATWLDIFIAEA